MQRRLQPAGTAGAALRPGAEISGVARQGCRARPCTTAARAPLRGAWCMRSRGVRASSSLYALCAACPGHQWACLAAHRHMHALGSCAQAPLADHIPKAGAGPDPCPGQGEAAPRTVANARAGLKRMFALLRKRGSRRTQNKQKHLQAVNQAPRSMQRASSRAATPVKHILLGDHSPRATPRRRAPSTATSPSLRP